MKKINFKHGLDRKQEIEARRFKDVLVGRSHNEEKILSERAHKIIFEFANSEYVHLKDYIKHNDVVVYSAIERAGGIKIFLEFVRKQKII